MTQLPNSGSKFDFVRTAQTYQSQEDIDRDREFRDSSVSELIGDYAVESAVETGRQLGDAAVFTARAIPTVSRELEASGIQAITSLSGMDLDREMALLAADSINPGRTTAADILEGATGLSFGRGTLADLGKERSLQQEMQPESQFDGRGLYLTPREIGSVGASVLMGVAAVASGGTLAAPATIAMGSQAFTAVMGDYAEYLGESGDDFDGRVASALLMLVAAETFGTKKVMIDLPAALGKKAGLKSFREILGAKTAAARTDAIKRAIKAGSLQLAGLAAQGGEEMVEEGLEGLARIMYEEEFDGLREKIMSGEIDEEVFSTAADVATEGGWKPFFLGAAGGGVVTGAASIRERFSTEGQTRRAREDEMIAREVAEEAAAVRRTEEEPEAVIADDTVEDVTADEVVEEDREPTVSDLDNDAWATQMVASNPDAVDELLLTPKSRKVKSQPPGRNKWASVLPKGLVTSAAERQRLFDRLIAAREAAQQAAEAATEGDIDVAPPAPEAAPVADAESEADMLIRQREVLLQEMEQLDPDSDEYMDLEQTLGMTETQMDMQGIEFSRRLDGPIESSQLDIEPGSQLGTARGGFATNRRTGRRMYTKRYPNRDQSSNEIIASKLYRAAGVNAPEAQAVVENGEVVGVATEVVEGLTRGTPRDAADGLVIDAWLGNWDVVGQDQDNLLVGPNGEAVRIDQGGALTTRAQGAPKGDAFGDNVGELTTLVEQNPQLEPTASQLRRGFDALRSLSDQQIRDIVTENGGDASLVRTLIRRRRDLLSQEEQAVNDQEILQEGAEFSRQLDAVNEIEGTDYRAMTDEEIKTLTQGQREIAENARTRLGRTVVFVTSASGRPAHNGWINSRNSDTMFIVVEPNVQEAISSVAAKRGMKERRVQEAYERSMLQAVLHENVHLSEDRLAGTSEDIKSDADRMLAHLLATRSTQARIEKLGDMFEAGKISEAEYASELRAESLTDFLSLSRSGIDTLFMDRGRVRNALGRLRRVANKLGGQKDVRIVSRVVQNMERGSETLPSSPDVNMPPVVDDVEMSRRFELAEEWFDGTLDMEVVRNNPSPKNLAVLMATRDIIKSDKPSINTVIKRLAPLGFEVTEETALQIREIYKETRSYWTASKSGSAGRMTELRGESEQFSPAGVVERTMSKLFESDPSPTAAQLAKMPGSPKPVSGEMVVKMSVTKTAPWSQKRADSFVDRAEKAVTDVEGKVAKTSDERAIESLMKKNDVVIFTGDGGPVIHANREWTDRFAAPVDYSEMKRVTVDAAKRGFHNWYREFGVFFKSLGDERLVNEAAMVFGVTSSQSAVENNISDTLHIMRLVREHKRDGKPWNKEALKLTLWPYLKKDGKKYKKNADDADFARGSDVRRNKFTQDKTASMFISSKQIDTIVDFYIDGTPTGGAIKTRTYSGSIAEGARNLFYPFSVQDRHQAATYGFFHGKFNSGNGNFTFDKIFNSDTEFRYASYLTQRLSMEPELMGLTPNQIQAAQWFYTKAGEGPYPEVEKKTDKGLIANFAKDNPDLTTGTLQSALRFAEFEIADLVDLMATLSEDAAYPAPDLQVPVYEKVLRGTHDYASGQAVAREFGEVMEMEAPRLRLEVTPSMSLPGLTGPGMGMTESVASDMIQSILTSVTETDGTVSLFNDMGIPHTPLTAGPVTTGGATTTQFAMVPMLGSITSDSTAKLLGATLGFGMMQPRVHVSRFTADGNAATVRLKTQSGSPLTPSTVAGVAMPTVKGAEVIQVTSPPNSDYVDIVINPESGSLSDSQIESAFKNISQEMSNAGIPVEGQVLRTEVNEIRQEEYRGIIEGSGLDISAEGQSGLLGRVLSEITAPALATLQANGYSFNRDQFQNETGLTRDQVSDLPAEFSRRMPLMTAEEMQKLKNVNSSEFDTIDLREAFINDDVSAGAPFAQWWSSLTEDERWSTNFWLAGFIRNGQLIIPDADSGLNGIEVEYPIEQSVIDKGVKALGSDAMSGHALIRAAALAGEGSRGWSLHKGVDAFLAQGMDQKEAAEEVMEAMNESIEESLRELDSLGMKRRKGFEGEPSLFLYNERMYIEFAGGEEVSVQRSGDTLRYIGDIVASAYIDEDYDYNYDGDGIPTDDSVQAMIDRRRMIFSVWNTITNDKLNELNTPASAIFEYLTAIHNKFIGAVSKGVPVKGKVYRSSTPTDPALMQQRFPPGSYFKTQAPASMSRSENSAADFGKKYNQGTFFEIETQTGRQLGMEDYKTMRLRELDADESAELRRGPEDAWLSASKMQAWLIESGNSLSAATVVPGSKADVMQDMMEQEVLSMPGSIYRVTGYQTVAGNVTASIEEVQMTPEEAANIPVMPEFSRKGPPTVAPTLSPPTEKQIEWRSKGVRRTLQDKFIELDYLQRDVIEAYGPLDMEVDALNRFRNIPGRVAFKSGRFADRAVKPLIRGIAKQGLTMAQFGEYAAAVHALDVNADMRARKVGSAKRPIDSGLSDSAANAIIAKMRQRPNFRKIENLRVNLTSIGKQNLRLAFNTGLISEAEYTNLKTKFPNYVPFWNSFDPETDVANGDREQFIVPANILKGRTGRDTDALAGDEKFFADRVAAMGDQRYRIIRKSEQNTALRRLFNLAEMIDDDNLMGRFTPPMEATTNVRGETIMVPSQAWRNDPTVFKVMVNGEAILLKINHPDLAEAIRSKPRQKGLVERLILGTASNYTSLKRFFSTQFGNPDFTLTNPLRDIQTAGASIAGDYKQLARMKDGELRKLSPVDRVRILAGSTKNIFGAWWTILTGGGTASFRRDLAKYRALGARQEFFDIQDPVKSRNAIKKITRSESATSRSLGGRTVKFIALSPKKFVDAWQHVNTMFDDGVRFATYRSLIKSGVNPEKAVQITRDLTVDFSRTGTAGRGINSMYAFANASVQGSTKTLRLLKSKAGASVFGAYFTVGILSELWNDDEEDRDGNLKSDWDEIPDWEKDSSVFIRLPGDGDEVSYAKVPVAYGLMIPYVAGRRFVKFLKGKETMLDGVLATAAASYSNLNPLGGEVISTESASDALSSTLRIVSPDIIDPTISLATNRDWLGNSIYNEPFPTDPSPVPSTMGRDSTAEWAKSMAGFVNEITGGDDVRKGAVSFQPEFATYMLGDIFSGAWRTVDRVGTMIQNQWIETYYPGEELSETTEIPGVRRFFTTAPREKDTQKDYYEFRDVAQAAEADIKEYAELGDYDKMDRMVDSTVAERTPKAFYDKIKELQKAKRDTVRQMKRDGAATVDILRERKYWDDIIKPLQAEAVILTREIQADGEN